MKAGVVTLNGNFNYGNRLQNFAVQQLLIEAGFEDVDTLVFSDVPIEEKLKQSVKKILGKNGPEARMTTGRKRAFAKFSEGIRIKQLSRSELDILNEYDSFFVGSDQVWNPGYMNRYQLPFLPFIEPNRKFSLAASFGVSELGTKVEKRYRAGLMSFGKISVREDEGAKLVKSICGREAEVVVDPTLAVPVDNWRKIANYRLCPPDDYIFAYLLGNTTEEQRAVIESLEQHYGIPVVYLSDRDSPKELPAGPAEFVGLIERAKHVVTTSFHGSVFASMFHSPLTILRRAEGDLSSFSRLQTLSNKLGLDGKIVDGGKVDFSLSSDYEGVDHQISQEAQKLRRFIQACVEC